MQNPPPETIGMRLREERKRAGLSLTIAADTADIHAATLSKYERGLLMPTAPKLLVLASLYDRSVHWLASGRTYGNNPDMNEFETNLVKVTSPPVMVLHVTEGFFSEEVIEELADYITDQYEMVQRAVPGNRH